MEVNTVLSNSFGFGGTNSALVISRNVSEHLNLATKTVDMEVNTVLSNSFGFGGTNSALVIERVKS